MITEQPQEVCEKYGFCAPETREKLAAAGFPFEKCRFGLTIRLNHIRPIILDGGADNIGLPAYPQFHEVWELLPYNFRHNGKDVFKVVNAFGYVGYVDMSFSPYSGNVPKGINICDSAALMWLALKEIGLLPDVQMNKINVQESKRLDGGC